MFHIITTIITGLVVGVLARFVYPGAVAITMFHTILLGVAGAFLAGLVPWLSSGRRDGFHAGGFFASLIGAVVLIFVGRHFLHIV